ncbi:ion transporter [Leptospira adleri]|nr:ion transporter [Leptospira adleri]
MSMFHVDNKLRIFWDILIFICILYASIESPLRVVLSYKQGFVVTGLYILVDILFFGDILVNIFPPEYVQGKWIHIQKKGIVKYFKTWFVFDFLAAFPFELAAEGIFNTDLSLHPFLYLLFGITRILKVVRIPGILYRLNLAFKPAPGILRLVLLMFWISVVAHWCAIGWLYIDNLDSIDTGLDQYVQALYWTITTLTTVGYGDIVPTTTHQRIYTICVMLTGALVYATVIGNVASILANLDLVRATKLQRMAQVDSFLRARKLPFWLRRKIRDYYMYIIERGWGENEKELLSDLPVSLQRDVRIHLHREFLEKVPFLKGADPSLVTSLIFSLKHHVFLPGDIIFHRGDIGHNLYVLSEGHVDVLAPDDSKVIVTLGDGQFFGELALVTAEPRSATIRCTSICEIYTLSKEDFLEALSLYPGFRDAMQESLRKLNVKMDLSRTFQKSRDSHS